MRCIKYSQNNPDSCGVQYSRSSSAFTVEEAWEYVFFSSQTLGSVSLILLLGPLILLLSEVSGSVIAGSVFCCFKTKTNKQKKLFGPFFQLSYLDKWLL